MPTMTQWPIEYWGKEHTNFNGLIIFLLSLNPELFLDYVKQQKKTGHGELPQSTQAINPEELNLLEIVRMFIYGLVKEETIARLYAGPVADKTLRLRDLPTQCYRAINALPAGNKLKMDVDKIFATFSAGGEERDHKISFIGYAVIHYIYDHIVVAANLMDTSGYLPFGARLFFKELRKATVLFPLVNPELIKLLPWLQEYVFGYLQAKQKPVFMSLIPIQSFIIGCIAQLVVVLKKKGLKGFIRSCTSLCSNDPMREPLLGDDAVDHRSALSQSLITFSKGHVLPLTHIKREHNNEDSRLIFSSLSTFAVFTVLAYFLLYGEKDIQKTVATRVSIPACTGAMWVLSDLMWNLMNALYILCKHGRR